MIVVADTSPLLHLARIGRLDLVVSALGPVIVPRTVWSELIQPGTRADVVEALRAASWIDVRDDPSPVDLGLDPGETAAILLAEALTADALLIDERRGRAVAEERGLAVIGTLGVLAAALWASPPFRHQAPAGPPWGSWGQWECEVRDDAVRKPKCRAEAAL